MNPPAFFSILTVSLNSAATIRKTLESVRQQRLQLLEHIVVDGGSRDGTVEILREFDGTYNLRWISEPDEGIGDALNKALEEAHGRYVLVIQADDRLISEGVLESIYPLLKNESFDIYSFPVSVEEPGGGRRPYRPFRIQWWYRFKTIFPHQGAFVHRRLYDRVGGYRRMLSIGVDYDFFYRALQQGASVCFGDQPVAVMGGAGLSSSRAHLTERIREEFRIQKMHEKNPFWRVLQLLFRATYFPYKTRLTRSGRSA